MELQVGGERVGRPGRVADLPGVQAGVPHRLLYGDAALVLVAQVFLRERAGQGAAADHAEREPGAFLVGKGDDLHRAFRTHALFLHRLEDLDPAEHAERPVEVAAVHDGVHVRAYQDRWGIRVSSFPSPEEVARGVLAHGEVCLLHVRCYEGLGRPFLPGKGEAGDAALFALADLRELREPLPQPSAVHHAPPSPPSSHPTPTC